MVAIKDIKTTNLAWPHNIGCEHITFINIVHYMEARYGEDYYFNFMTRPAYEQTSKELIMASTTMVLEGKTSHSVLPAKRP